MVDSSNTFRATVAVTVNLRRKEGRAFSIRGGGADIQLEAKFSITLTKQLGWRRPIPPMGSEQAPIKPFSLGGLLGSFWQLGFLPL